MLVMGMLSFFWATPTRKWITSTCAALAAIFGVIIKAPEALESWDGQGLPTPATRGWTRVQTAEMKLILLDINAGKREAAERSRDRLELEFLDAKTPDAQIKNKQLQRKEQETIDALAKQADEIKKRK